MFKKIRPIFATFLLSACSLSNYQPVETIKQVNPTEGYRLKNTMEQNRQDGHLIVLIFSGGGSRAAALGYGVLEAFKETQIRPSAKGNTLLDNIDVVYGVSGGSILAAYFALEGQNVIPKFSEHFLKKNFQKEFVTQALSFSNLPRITSPEFGRGDLLQEQLNLSLYHNKTFNDLITHRKGPFAVISATDMSFGQRLTFTQDNFDALCLNLGDLEISRAVAASSAVPLIFSPLTLNNAGGKCHFNLPKEFTQNKKGENKHKTKTVREIQSLMEHYQKSDVHPFIHLLDGGLTDNLGLDNLLDMYDVMGVEQLYQQVHRLQFKNIIIINVNAQNEVSHDIDLSANVPGTAAVINTIINVPIDKTTQNTLRRFREFTDEWNKRKGNRVPLHFVSLNLKDLPEGTLKQEVLNISTSFYLPKSDVDKLRQSAQILLNNSKEYHAVLEILR